MQTHFEFPNDGVLAIVLRHGEGLHDPNQWTWEPTVIAGVAIFTGLYLLGIGPLRRRYRWGPPIEPWRIALFLLGNLVLLLALISPLEVLSDEYLFSAHMVQHMLLILVVPPLWLLGTLDWLLRPLLNRPVLARMARLFLNPIFDFLIITVVFALWHWPPLYDWALADERIHILQHLTFIGAAVLNWWPIFSPLPELRLPNLQQVLYLFLDCQPQVALGALFVFSRDVIFQSYDDAPRLLGLSPIADQQLGGLIMWIPGNFVYLTVASIILVRWLMRGERTDQANEPQIPPGVRAKPDPPRATERRAFRTRHDSRQS